MAQILAEISGLDQDSVPSTVREVHVDGNTLSTDGKGKIMYELTESLFDMAVDKVHILIKDGEIPDMLDRLTMYSLYK